MKTWIATALGVAVGLSPAIAMAAGADVPRGSPWLVLLFYVINFAIFVYLLVHYAGPAASSFFHQRAARIRDNLQRLQAAMRAAQAQEEQAKALVAGLAEEKARLLSDMRDITEREAARIDELARIAADRIRRDGELMAQATAEEARRNLRSRVAAAAVASACKIIATEFDSSDQERVINEFIETLRHGAAS